MYKILLIDKPKGITSHDVVSDLRRHLNLRRIGHAGTLDPFATGLMILLIDKATKLSKYFITHDKEYLAEITLGIETDSQDITGNILKRSPVDHLDETLIRDALKSFLGAQKQIPPIYSAIKKDGHKLVDLARKNKDIPEIDARDVEIYSISDIMDFYKDEESIKFSVKIKVSKGTYIRSFAKDLGIALGTVGCLSNLRRLKVGPFDLEQAVCLERIHTLDYQFLDPLDFLDLDRLTISDEFAKLVENGRFLPIDLFSSKNDTILFNELKIPIAIYTYDETKEVMRMSVMLN